MSRKKSSGAPANAGVAGSGERCNTVRERDGRRPALLPLRHLRGGGVAGGVPGRPAVPRRAGQRLAAPPRLDGVTERRCGMTEAEWEACLDPQVMLRFLGDTVSD